MPALPLRLLLAGLLAASSPWAAAQCPASTPVQGATPPAPVFPADNWWNVDIRSAPVDPHSSDYIAFIGGSRRLHPDFGGEESAGSQAIYGFPYAIVDGTQPLQSVDFDYWDESDGVDPDTGEGVPFYPIPVQAITQPHWIEGGAPGDVDQRDASDRHLLVIDCSRGGLYELYNVFHDGSGWHAGSGAYFDLYGNARRPEGWTSADAAGLAIFPGLVRYDEAANPALAELHHALRVTVRASNGHVFPASHTAGSTAGALPLGARLRLKTSVNGADPALRTSDPIARRIFRAMQDYGLIVADNGSDMYISGTFDVRWNNDLLNPAFSALTAADFEVVKLGWQPETDDRRGLARSTGDFDGDGHADLLWRNAANGSDTIWRSADARTRQSMTGVTDLQWRIVGVGDFDADGRDDVLWRHRGDGRDVVWDSARTSRSLLRVTSQDWQVAGVGDFNGDHRDDILWRNERTGANTIWNSGDATNQVAVTHVANLDWHVGGIGDFNGDGRADILWRNHATGANTVWRSGRADTTQAVTTVASQAWEVVGVADFDGDHHDDLLWRNRSSGANVIWRSASASLRQVVGTLADAEWRVDGTADYDGDGQADIAWRHHGNGADMLWPAANASASRVLTAVGDLAWRLVP